MAESEDKTPEQQLVIQKIYTKDISFESPNTPAVFLKEWKPEVNMELNTNANKTDNKEIFEIVLTITITVKIESETIYLTEVHQAGLFTVSGFNDTDLNAILGSFCPNALFPYAREAISDLVTRGGFPQLLLAPVNFDALYQQHLDAQKNTDKDTATTH
ncbi:MAG: protein-export chaperone SecB [Gammaproteobacteria bacterium]